MKQISVIGIFFACIGVITVITYAIKLKLLNKYVLWAFIAFAVTIIVAMIIYQIHLSMTKEEREKDFVEKKAKQTSEKYFERINDLLKRRAGGDIIQWGGGIQVRMKKRIFSDKGKERRYLGVSGMLSKLKKFVVVIYSIDDDDMEEYYGDPSPQLLADPFYDFNPFRSGVGEEYKHSFGRAYQRGIPSEQVKININSKDSRDDVDELGDKAADIMKSFEMENE